MYYVNLIPNLVYKSTVKLPYWKLVIVFDSPAGIYGQLKSICTETLLDGEKN